MRRKETRWRRIQCIQEERTRVHKIIRHLDVSEQPMPLWMLCVKSKEPIL